MNKILNILLGIAACIAVVALLVDESRNDDESGKTVISFMSTGSREQRESYERVIQAFEKEHPDLKVRLEWGTTGRFFGVVLTRMAGGVPPDVVFMYESQMPHFADKNTLEDLSPYIERDLRDYEEDFHPLAQRILAYRGRTYAMPITMAPLVVLYNRKLFDEAGVPYPHADWTWDECLQIARRLTRKDASGLTVQYGFAEALSPDLIELMTAQRGLLPGPPLKANYAAPEMMEAVTFATDLVTKYGVAPNTASQEAVKVPLFDAGRAAMIITGRWMCPTYNKIKGFEFDAANMPRWRDGQRRTYTHAVGYAMSRECRQKEAAWLFLKFLGSRASQRMLTELGDTVPTRKSVLNSESFLTPAVQPANDQAYIDSLEYSRFRMVTDPRLPDYFPQAVEFLNLGTGNVKEKLSEVQDQANRFIETKHVVLRE